MPTARFACLYKMDNEEYFNLLQNHQVAVNYFLLQAGVAYALTHQRRKRKNRQIGVNEINKKRDENGFYENLYKELRVHPVRFFKFFRMSIRQFDLLCELIEPHMPAKDVLRHRPFPTDMRLAVALRFLAAGDSTHTIASAFCIGDSTCREIVAETCGAISKALMSEYIQPPTKEQYVQIAEEFEQKWNLPNCIGAVDGKHIIMRCPPNSGSTFVNCTKQFSVTLLAVCDAQYRFIIAEVGYTGIMSDVKIFRESPFGKSILEETHPIPDARILPKSDQSCNYFFVGDEAFALRSDFLIPFGKAQLSGPDEGVAYNRWVFNYRLSSSKRIIENTFGILAARWRIFHRKIEANPQTACKYVEACVCLHNFLIKTKEISGVRLPKDYFGDICNKGEISVEGDWRKSAEASQMQDLPARPSCTPSISAHCQRDMLAKYLAHDNTVEWQDKFVNEQALTYILDA